MSAADGVALGAAASTSQTSVQLIVFVAIMLHKVTSLTPARIFSGLIFLNITSSSHCRSNCSCNSWNVERMKKGCVILKNVAPSVNKIYQ